MSILLCHGFSQCLRRTSAILEKLVSIPVWLMIQCMCIFLLLWLTLPWKNFVLRSPSLMQQCLAFYFQRMSCLIRRFPGGMSGLLNGLAGLGQMPWPIQFGVLISESLVVLFIKTTLEALDFVCSFIQDHGSMYLQGWFCRRVHGPYILEFEVSWSFRFLFWLGKD